MTNHCFHKHNGELSHFSPSAVTQVTVENPQLLRSIGKQVDRGVNDFCVVAAHRRHGRNSFEPQHLAQRGESVEEARRLLLWTPQPGDPGLRRSEDRDVPSTECHGVSNYFSVARINTAVPKA